METPDKKQRKPLEPWQIEDAKRLQAAIEAYQAKYPGVTQLEIAQRCGWKSQGSLWQYANGTIPLNLRALVRICAAMAIDKPESISPKIVAEARKVHSTEEELIRAFHPEDPAGDEEVRIPEETVRFSGGAGHLVSYEISNDREPATYRISWFQKERINPSKAKRFRVVGDSMEPLLYPGDSILVNLEETTVREGQVYVFRHGDELKVKKLFPKSDGSLVLRSVNREEYPDDVVPPDVVAEQITIIGRVRDKSGRGGL